MNKAQEAIIEFFEEAMVTVHGAAKQTRNVDELISMIVENIETDKNNLLRKYSDEE